MKNLNLELDFNDGRLSKLPHSSIAQVHVQNCGGYESNPLRYITQQCMTISEFDYEIDRLKQELENIRTRGHAKFRANGVMR